jgi:hypothetical protein
LPAQNDDGWQSAHVHREVVKLPQKRMSRNCAGAQALRQSAAWDKPLDFLRDCVQIETQTEHVLALLENPPK